MKLTKTKIVAVILSVLLTVVLGCLDFGRGSDDQNIATADSNSTETKDDGYTWSIFV